MVSSYAGIGVLLILFGLIQVFVKDAAWNLQEFQNRLRGVVSERTADWGRLSTIVGVCCAVIGMLAIGIAISSQIKQRRTTRRSKRWPDTQQIQRNSAVISRVFVRH